MAINDMGLVFYASRALLTLILLAFLTSLLATAFQCPLPTPWHNPTGTICPHATAIYKYVAITSMATDILLCVLAVVMVWALRDRWTKVLTVALFASRILCEIARPVLDAGHIPKL